MMRLNRSPRASTAVAFGALPTLWSLAHARSAAVANWAPPSLPIVHYGPLRARTGGVGDDAVVLLHGLISTGDVFGAPYDSLATARRLVVPDLLGFGRSMDEYRTSFQIDAHLEALDVLAAGIGLFASERWTIGAHSMGSSLALRWAARHSGRVARVVCWGAPLYRSPEAARDRVAGSVMARLFALDTELAARACAISCRHRTAAGWLSAAFEPRLPVQVARAAPLHTWPAYRDAVRDLVIEPAWDELITTCDNAGVEVVLAWGDRDRVGDRDHADEIESRCSSAVVMSVHGADHLLPMTHPAICIEQLTGTEISDGRRRPLISP